VQALTITKFGGPEVMEIFEEPSPSIQQDGVRIKVAAAGVNFADLMMRMGMYPEAPKRPFVPGYEVAGTVTEVGRQVRDVHVGDRVVAGTKFGGYATEVVVPDYQVRKIPAHLSEIEAAAIPVNFLTAWVALMDMARVRKGDRVLIPSAAGGVGVAAVQMAAQAGAHVVGLVGNPEKAKVVKSLGATETMTNQEWEEAEDETVGSFDTILDASGGESLKRSYRRLAAGGRVVSFGLSSAVTGPKRSLLTIASFFKNTPLFPPFKLMMDNKGVFGLNMLQLFEPPVQGKPNIMNAALDQIMKGFEEKRFKVIIGKTFPLAQGSAAHAHLQSRANIGKVILTM